MIGLLWKSQYTESRHAGRFSAKQTDADENLATNSTIAAGQRFAAEFAAKMRDRLRITR
jgi:hypothetical protein